jgi:hypothetical protein
MMKAKKKTNRKWLLIPTAFMLWSVIYTLLVLYKQPSPNSYQNVWNERRMEVNVSTALPAK